MNNLETTPFEEKVYRAVRVPEPSQEFTGGLWAKIVELNQMESHDLSKFPGSIPLIRPKILIRKPFFHRFQIQIIMILVVLLVGILFFNTPSGRAVAQSILNFFTRSESNILPAPTEIPLVWVEQTPGVPAATVTPLPGPAFSDECGDYPDPKCNVAQIRSKVDFPIKELGVIPASMYFIGSTGEPDRVYIFYGTQDHSENLILIEQPWTGSSDQTPLIIGASAVVETVKIGNSTGEYVKGSFTYRSGETQEHWDADADNQILHWVDDGVFFQIINSGIQLDQDSFIDLAGSLTTEPVTVELTPVPETSTQSSESYDFSANYPLTIPEAEKIAGFKIAQPSKLPELLTLLGASIEPEQAVVSIFYLRSQDMGPTTDGLLLKEEIIPSDGRFELSSFVIGDKTEIDNYPPGILVGAIEKVQIGEIQGQYVEGTWHGTDCCGWVWKADPYLKRLHWQMKDTVFELLYMGMDITKEDMILIAKSMT